MANVTSTAETPDPIGVWYSPTLLDIAVPKLIHMQFGMKKGVPDGHGKTIRFSRYEELDEATQALNEITDPDGQTMIVTRMDAELKEYGDIITITDAVKKTNRDPVLMAGTIRLGEQMGRTLDTLTLDTLVSTGSVYNCQYGNNLRAITNVTDKDLDDINDILMVNDATQFESEQLGSDKFGSAPLDASYYTMGHVKMLKDLKKLESWAATKNYPREMAKKIAEKGATDFQRWCLTSKGSVDSTAGYAIYDFITCGMDAYGIIDMDSEGFNEQGMDTDGNIRPAAVIYTAPGGQSDAMKRRHKLAWKAFHACKVLNDNWLVRGRASLAA